MNKELATRIGYLVVHDVLTAATPTIIKEQMAQIKDLGQEVFNLDQDVKEKEDTIYLLQAKLRYAEFCLSPTGSYYEISTNWIRFL